MHITRPSQGHMVRSTYLIHTQPQLHQLVILKTIDKRTNIPNRWITPHQWPIWIISSTLWISVEVHVPRRLQLRTAFRKVATSVILSSSTQVLPRRRQHTSMDLPLYLITRPAMCLHIPQRHRDIRQVPLMQDSSMLAVPRLYQASSQNMAISKRRLGIKYLEDNLMTVTTVRLVITDMKAVLYIHRHRHLRRTVVLLPQELRPNVQA
jgi:hypothetical protein